MAITEKPVYKIDYIDICRNCKGTGALKYPSHSTSCDICKGHGRVLIHKEIKITIETL